MAELPISSKYRSTPGLPVDDAERAELNQRLNAAFEAGKFDADEYRERLDRLYSAQTLGELLPVVTGLPVRPTHETPNGIAVGSIGPGELTPSRPGPGPGVVAAGAGALVLVLLVVLLAVF